MLPVDVVAELLLEEPAGASGTQHVEAASGLALVGDTFYVVADDDTYLAIFRDMGRKNGVTQRILPDELSPDPSERKKNKPDLESLTFLAPFERFEHGGLITLGSGSGDERTRGVFASFGADQEIDEIVHLDAGPLMGHLAEQIPELNLEGTAVTGQYLRIFQRGNEPGSTNAHIDLDLQGLCRALADGKPLDASLLAGIREHDLGAVKGTKLCFSDADTVANGTIVFSASAETQGEGVDGRPLGSAVGVMTSEGEVIAFEPIDVETKVEGLAARAHDGHVEAFMVTDDDDPHAPTLLLRTVLPDRLGLAPTD